MYPVERGGRRLATTPRLGPGRVGVGSGRATRRAAPRARRDSRSISWVQVGELLGESRVDWPRPVRSGRGRNSNEPFRRGADETGREGSTAVGYEPRGRGFESLRGYHTIPDTRPGCQPRTTGPLGARWGNQRGIRWGKSVPRVLTDHPACGDRDPGGGEQWVGTMDRDTPLLLSLVYAVVCGLLDWRPGVSWRGHRAGIRTVILPKENERDLEDVPPDLRRSWSSSPWTRPKRCWHAVCHRERPEPPRRHRGDAVALTAGRWPLRGRRYPSRSSRAAPSRSAPWGGSRGAGPPLGPAGPASRPAGHWRETTPRWPAPPGPPHAPDWPHRPGPGARQLRPPRGVAGAGPARPGPPWPYLVGSLRPPLHELAYPLAPEPDLHIRGIGPVRDEAVELPAHHPPGDQLVQAAGGRRGRRGRRGPPPGRRPLPRSVGGNRRHGCRDRIGAGSEILPAAIARARADPELRAGIGGATADDVDRSPHPGETHRLAVRVRSAACGCGDLPLPDAVGCRRAARAERLDERPAGRRLQRRQAQSGQQRRRDVREPAPGGGHWAPAGAQWA